MSYKDYEKALKIMNENKEKCDFFGKCSEDLIEKAEKALGIKFSKIYKNFLMNFGAGNYGSEEIYGIIGEDFIDSSVPNGIWYTLIERKQVNLPKNLVVIYDTCSDELFCLDFNKLNDENEPEVVTYIPGERNENQLYEKIANDFGEFLLELVIDDNERDDF